MSTILIIDDGEVNREILKRAFNGDYEVLEAENGEDAIEALYSNRDRVDLILLDLLMPKMGGVEFLEEIIKREDSIKLPVLIMTGDEEIDKKQRCLSMGIAGFIDKPLNVNVIKEWVNELISKCAVIE